MKAFGDGGGGGTPQEGRGISTGHMRPGNTDQDCLDSTLQNPSLRLIYF